jgi:tetratricopeptide (TPR) repeat protein
MRMLGRNAIVNSVIFGILFTLPGLLPGMSAATAQAQTPQQTLNQYVTDLQKNPNDYVLREKIIRHVQAMKPAPTVPEGARRHYVMAKTLSDEAKKVEDFNDSIAEFRGALLVAPWWAEANRDFGLTLEAAQRYDEAIAYIKLYMATNPGSDRTRAAQDEIYKIEAKKKLAGKAAKESSPQAISDKKQEEYANWLKKIDGRKYRDTRGGVPAVIEVRGNALVTIGPGSDGRMTVLAGPWEIKGRTASTPRVLQKEPFLPVQTTFIISENGDRIIEHRDFSDGDMREYVWVWQR